MVDNELSILKEKVAIALKMINKSGLGDYSGHVSLRVPGKDQIVINGRMTSRAAIQTENILVCDYDGNKIVGEDIPPAEVAIHTQLLKRRKDINCVAHFHPPKAVLFSVVERPLIPVFLKGAMVGSVPIHSDPRHIKSVKQGDELATSLGDNKVALLRGHGAVVVGKTVEEAFFLGVCLEENARRYYEALVLGEVKPLTDQEQADLVESGYSQERFKKIWDYYYSLYL